MFGILGVEILFGCVFVQKLGPDEARHKVLLVMVRSSLFSLFSIFFLNDFSSLFISVNVTLFAPPGLWVRSSVLESVHAANSVLERWCCGPARSVSSGLVGHARLWPVHRVLREPRLHARHGTRCESNGLRRVILRIQTAASINPRALALG